MPILYNLIIAENGKPRYSRLEFCHACGSTDIILNKTPEGRNTFRCKHGQWQCINCGASVAAHSDGLPQGYMANADIRAHRYNFHKAMDVLLKQKYTYPEICTYLQARLSIEADHLHSAWLTKGELVLAINAMYERAKRPEKNRPYRVEIARKNSRENIDRRQKQIRHMKEGYYSAG